MKIKKNYSLRIILPVQIQLLEIENPKIDSPYYTDENMGYHGMITWDAKMG
jgi:hypothetical protein